MISWFIIHWGQCSSSHQKKTKSGLVKLFSGFGTSFRRNHEALGESSPTTAPKQYQPRGGARANNGQRTTISKYFC
jgi:hypothetical protein